MIYAGTNEMPVYLGADEITAIYAGSEQIYPYSISGFTVKPLTLSFPIGGGDKVIRIVSEYPWTASTPDSWLSLSAASGASGRTSITVTADPNQTGTELSGTVVITSTDLQHSATVDVIQEAYSLPNKAFVFNYNAKDYNASTYTIPNEIGGSLNMDMVWTATTSTIRNQISFVDDHLVIPNSATSIFTFSSSGNNPLNYTSNNVNLTVVFKAKYAGTGTNRGTFICVQDNRGLNWAVRIGNRENYQASDTRISHIVGNAQANWDKALSYTCGDTITAYVRSQFSGSQIHTEIKDITNGQSATPFDSNYTQIGSPTQIKFFNTPYFAGEFYWVYVSREVLTDEEIQQVVNYNEHK